MNYKKIYDAIIDRASKRKIDGYKEHHHIVPRCMDGDDSKSNLVSLTPEEHYLCHQLLVKIFPNKRSLIYAAQMMCNSSNGARVNNKLYGWIKRAISADRKHNNPSKRPDVREKISTSLKGNVPWNKGKKGIQRAWNRGLKHTDYTKELMSKNHRCKRGFKPSFEGRVHNQETKDKISKALKEKGVMPPSAKGRKLSGETRERMRISQQLRRNREQNGK